MPGIKPGTAVWANKHVTPKPPPLPYSFGDIAGEQISDSNYLSFRLDFSLDSQIVASIFPDDVLAPQHGRDLPVADAHAGDWHDVGQDEVDDVEAGIVQVLN